MVSVVGWDDAIAEIHHFHLPSIDGFRITLPILRGLGGIRRPTRRDNPSIGNEPNPKVDADLLVERALTLHPDTSRLSFLFLPRRLLRSFTSFVTLAYGIVNYRIRKPLYCDRKLVDKVVFK